MTTAMSITPLPQVAANGMTRDVDGYFNVSIETPIETALGAGKGLAIVKRSDVSNIDTPADVAKYGLFFGLKDGGQLFMPTDGLMSVMTVAIASVAGNNLVLTLTSDDVDAVAGFKIDYIAVAQMVIPLDKDAFRAYRPGTKFFVTVDYAPTPPEQADAPEAAPEPGLDVDVLTGEGEALEHQAEELLTRPEPSSPSMETQVAQELNKFQPLDPGKEEPTEKTEDLGKWDDHLGEVKAQVAETPIVWEPKEEAVAVSGDTQDDPTVAATIPAGVNSEGEPVNKAGFPTEG